MFRVPSTLSEEVEETVRRTVDVGFAVHRELGPGFKECIYEEAFCVGLLMNFSSELFKKGVKRVIL